MPLAAPFFTPGTINGMSTSTPDAPRYATLRDYVRVIRSNRLLILAITLACGVAAFALTARQTKTYQAQASVFFQDTTQNAELVGTQAGPTLTDLARAQLNAQKVTGSNVAKQVKKDLRSPLNPTVLASSISTFVNMQNNFVVIQATSRNPGAAEQLANAFADATKTVSRDEARSQYAALATGARAQFSRLLDGSKDPLTREAYANRVATLGFLAQTADPVEIVQPATLPTTPAGPHTVRNTALGLLLGLTIALLAAFGRDALDRRLRSSGQISDELEWPILGHVRETAFGSALFLSDNGGSEAEGDRESFRILRQNIRFLDMDRAPTSVVVTSALPEEGKSTVAGALACACAAAGLRTLLVECDLRRPSLAKQFRLKSAPGLTDFLLGKASPPDILQVVDLPGATPLAPPSSNGAGANGSAEFHDAPGSHGRRLVCITAGRGVIESAELLNSGRFKQFLRDVESAYDQVILDAGPLLAVADTAVLLPEADATLICVRAGRTTHDQAAALRQAVNRLPHRLLGIVVTGVRPGADQDLGYYSCAYSYQASR